MICRSIHHHWEYNNAHWKKHFEKSFAVFIQLLLDTVSDFHLHEDNSIRSMTRSISSLLLEGSALKNMSITFDNPLIESARNQYKNNIGISHSLQNTHNEKEEHSVP